MASYYAAVVFNANGGTGAPDNLLGYNDAATVRLTIPSTTPTRSGYAFLGWSTSPTATAAEFTAGGKYYFTASEETTTHTLYAVWQSTGGGGSGGGGSGGGTTDSDGKVYINGVAYTPYVCGGNGWQAAKLYICGSGGWTITKE